MQAAQALPSQAADLAENSCRVRAFKKAGELHGLWVEFEGPDLKFPSKNRKRVVFPRGRFRPVIVKDSSVQADINAITTQFEMARNGRPVSFGLDLIKVIVLLPARQRAFDSHNFNEFIADWLEDVGVVINDNQIEMKSIKRSEYQQFNDYLIGYPKISDSPNATTIICLRRNDQIARIEHARILEDIRLSTGMVELIG